MTEPPLDAARESGLVRPGEPLLVLVSGGGDSMALLDVAVRLGARVSALHVNYGLREGADGDEALVRALCSDLGVELQTERVRLGDDTGNLQERARNARYALAERLAAGDYAAAHTASDQAETVLYRLAVSPGSRALQGMPSRRGRLVRPFLAVTRDEVRHYLRARGIEWREDPSNTDRRFARARVRHDLLDALRRIGPAAERTLAETARQLSEDRGARHGGGRCARGAGRWARGFALGPARAAVRGAPAAAAPAGRRPAGARLDRRARRAWHKSVDLGGGLRAVAEYGTLRFTRAAEQEAPAPVALPIPGRARFGDWEVEAADDAPGEVAVPAALSPRGDRARLARGRPHAARRPRRQQDAPGISSPIADPRALRRTLPIVETRGEIVWVAGVALDERFAAAGEGTGRGLERTQCFTSSGHGVGRTRIVGAEPMLAGVASPPTRARLAAARRDRLRRRAGLGRDGLLRSHLVPQEPGQLNLRAALDGDVRYLLGFRSAASNLGRGPLIVDAERDLRRPLELAATQVIRRVSGPAERRPLGPALTYVVSSDHSHWHYPAFMRYELRRPAADGGAGGTRPQDGLLPGRSLRRASAAAASGRAALPPFTTACGKNRPNLARLREGISVGYGDDYAPLLEGQSIDVTELPPGRYRLVHTVNPDRSLAERSYRNNVSSLALRIGRDEAGQPKLAVKMSP